MSYHMLDAVAGGMFPPPDEIAFTNTINCVLQILMFGDEFFG